MRFSGTLLKPLDQQHDIDGEYIDPIGVRFDPNWTWPVHLDFDLRRPPIGTAKVSRRADGGLVVDGDLAAPVPMASKLAISVRVARHTKGGITTLSDLAAIGITDRHADPDQPLIWMEA